MENLLVALLIVVAVILVCREIVCWYWKINEITRQLLDQQRSQRKLVEGIEAVNRNLASILDELRRAAAADAEELLASSSSLGLPGSDAPKAL